MCVHCGGQRGAFCPLELECRPLKTWLWVLQTELDLPEPQMLLTSDPSRASPSWHGHCYWIADKFKINVKDI